jgi:hypothetical protein
VDNGLYRAEADSVVAACPEAEQPAGSADCRVRGIQLDVETTLSDDDLANPSGEQPPTGPVEPAAPATQSSARRRTNRLPSRLLWAASGTSVPIGMLSKRQIRQLTSVSG